MDLASWSVGLSLIVLTIAIHTTAVVLMAFGLETKIRFRVDKHKPDRLRAIPTVIGHIGAVALILTALHGFEGILWASAYWRIGALDSFTDASVYVAPDFMGPLTPNERRAALVPAVFTGLLALADACCQRPLIVEAWYSGQDSRVAGLPALR